MILSGALKDKLSIASLMVLVFACIIAYDGLTAV
jgi:hypothetical protein